MKLKKSLTILFDRRIIQYVPDAGMAELADALDSGSSESNFMQVQVLFPARDLGQISTIWPYFFYLQIDSKAFT